MRSNLGWPHAVMGEYGCRISGGRVDSVRPAQHAAPLRHSFTLEPKTIKPRRVPNQRQDPERCCSESCESPSCSFIAITIDIIITASHVRVSIAPGEAQLLRLGVSDACHQPRFAQRRARERLSCNFFGLSRNQRLPAHNFRVSPRVFLLQSMHDLAHMRLVCRRPVLRNQMVQFQSCLAQICRQHVDRQLLSKE